MLQVLAPLRVRDYRRLWVGQVISVVGDKVNQIAMAIMVFAVTNSVLQMGIMLGVTALPAALFGLPAGVYVDRWNRRITMIVSDLIRGAVVVAIPFVIRYGVWWVYALAFLSSTVALFFLPAKRSLIPDLVPDSDLVAANSLDNASESIAELVGLGLGAGLVATIGYAWAFTLDGITFLLSAIMIASIGFRQERLPFAETEPDFLAETVAGVSAIWTNDVLRQLSGIYITSAMFASAAIAVVYALALKTFAAGAPGIALLDAATAVGMLLGAALIGRSAPGHLGVKFLGGLTAFGVAFATVGFAGSIWIAMVLLMLAGVANMFFFIPATTLFQTRVDASVRGRVLAANTTGTRISMVIGIIAAGALGERYPIKSVAIAVGILAVAASAIGWTRRALREA